MVFSCWEYNVYDEVHILSILDFKLMDFNSIYINTMVHNKIYIYILCTIYVYYKLCLIHEIKHFEG